MMNGLNQYAADPSSSCGSLISEQGDGTALFIFRTEFCEESHELGKCTDDKRCHRSHCRTWQRRNPLLHLYVSEMCDKLSFEKLPNGKQKLNKECKKGQTCLYSHSNEERIYHPTQYKTKACNNQKCREDQKDRHYWCPFVHAGEPQRNISDDVKKTVQEMLISNINSHVPMKISAIEDPIFRRWFAEARRMAFLQQGSQHKAIPCSHLGQPNYFMPFYQPVPSYPGLPGFPACPYPHGGMPQFMPRGRGMSDYGPVGPPQEYSVYPESSDTPMWMLPQLASPTEFMSMASNAVASPQLPGYPGSGRERTDSTDSSYSKHLNPDAEEFVPSSMGPSTLWRAHA